MAKAGGIPDSVKWQAVMACDKRWDGLFFYGVKTTGVFCRPACRAKAPRRENVVFFHNAEAALAAGFRPCKKCRPDLLSFAPDMELVSQAAALFAQQYNQPITAGAVSRLLGVSAPHLTRLFKHHQGCTPRQYLTKVRVAMAAKLLRQSDAAILEIAYAVGFVSLSNFYRCFQAHTGETPSRFRKKQG